MVLCGCYTPMIWIHRLQSRVRANLIGFLQARFDAKLLGPLTNVSTFEVLLMAHNAAKSTRSDGAASNKTEGVMAAILTSPTLQTRICSLHHRNCSLTLLPSGDAKFCPARAGRLKLVHQYARDSLWMGQGKEDRIQPILRCASA